MKPLFARRTARGDRRGVALMFVLAAVMILTVLVTDMRFGAQVRFMLATHTRDEAEALGLAHSGIGFYRLILLADRQIPSTIRNTMMGGMSLIDMFPMINTGLLRMVMTSGGNIDDQEVEDFKATGQVSDKVREKSEEQSASRFGKSGFLDFDGDFDASIVGEDCRINLNTLATHQTGQNIQEMAAAQLIYKLMSGEENEQWLRDRNLDPWDLIGNIVDWVDTDNVRSTATGGYEDELYNHLSSPYLSKNAPFDTKEELRLVEGWQDEVYERFGEKLTVYGSQKININCADNDVVTALIQANVTPQLGKDDLERILTELAVYKSQARFLKAADAKAWFTGQIPNLPPSFVSNLSVTSKVFRIKSTGQIGETTVTVTAVINYDPATGSKEGKFVYWRVQ